MPFSFVRSIVLLQVRSISLRSMPTYLFLLSFSFNFADLSTTCLLFSLHIAFKKRIGFFKSLWLFFVFIFYFFCYRSSAFRFDESFIYFRRWRWLLQCFSFWFYVVSSRTDSDYCFERGIASSQMAGSVVIWNRRIFLRIRLKSIVACRRSLSDPWISRVSVIKSAFFVLDGKESCWESGYFGVMIV